MANRGTRKSVAFRDEGPEGIWCKYCSKVYDDPKLLPCLHTFCKRCIGLITEENGDSLFCPICRSEVALPSKNVEDLKSNVTVLRKLEEFDRQKLRQREEDCSGCDNGRNIAVNRCLQCQEFLCGDCTLAHRRVKFTREHEILSLEEFVDRTNPKDDSSFMTCANHNTEDIDMYCKTCDLLTCKECRRTVDHEGHEIVSLQNAVDSTKPTLLSLLDATQKNIPTLQRSVYEIIKVYGRWQNKIDDISWQIRRTSRRLIQAIKEREHQLLRELNTIKDNRCSVLVKQKEEIERNLVCTIDGCDFSEEILKQGRDADILMVNNLICQRLCGLQEIKTGGDLNSVKIGFDPDERPILEAIKDAFGSISVGHEPPEQANEDQIQLKGSLPNGGSSVSFASVEDEEAGASSLSSESQESRTGTRLAASVPSLNDPKSTKKAKGRRFSFPALTVGKKASEPVGKLTPTEFVIPTTDSRGRPREVAVQLESPDGSVISAQVLDNKNGTYSIFYCPRSPGDHNLFVSLTSKHIKHGRRILNFYGSFSGLKSEELSLVCKTLCLIKWHVTPGMVEVKDGKKRPGEIGFKEVGQSEA